MKTLLVFLALGGGLVQPAGAEIYKCIEAGKVVYSDHPCPEGTGKAISVKPANSSSPGFSGFDSFSRPMAVAPIPGSKQAAPAKSLDGHFEDLSYDNPQAAAAAAAAMGRRIGGGASYGSGGGAVFTGPRGGQYTITSGGNKSYLPRR